jgi:hypothetical protein
MDTKHRAGPTSTTNAKAQASLREKRYAPRRRCFLYPGKIYDLNRCFLADCVFHDMSVSGARVRLSANQPLPRAIHLYDDRNAKMIEAKIVWRRALEVGLHFKARRG